MISIDTNFLEKDLNTLKNLIEEYEQIFLNLYNEVNSSSFYWQDNLAKKFYNDVIKEKNNTRNALLNLQNIYNAQNMIYINYKNIANKIVYYHENKNDIINKLEAVENQFKNINKQFNNLNTWFCTYYEINKITTLKNQFYNKFNQFLTVKQDILEKMQEIEEIENKIKSKINNMDVLTVKGFVNNEYL